MTPPTLSVPVAVMMILSLLLGVITHLVQTGSLGPIAAPTTWLPYFTIAAAFLGGAVSYLTGLTPPTIDGPSIFYAIIAGMTNLVASSTPGLAVHAHVTVARQMLAWRTADAITQPGTSK